MNNNSRIKQQARRNARRVLYLLRTFSERKKRYDILSHRFYKKPSVPDVIVPDIPAGEKDVHYAERILKAFQLAMKEYRSPDQDLWTMNTRLQAKFVGLLKGNDPVALAQYLCNMNKEDATIGTIQGNYEYERMLDYPAYRKFLSLMHKDKLVSLAEAVGALPIENPEQGVYGKNIHADPETLLHKISAAIGQDITPPAIDGGLLKIKAGNALFNERDCNAIYTALQVRSANSICEIGGGTGRVCYWSKRFGVGEYTILDLPHINVVQSFYLLKALDGAVSLFGETGRSVRVIPCHVLPGEKFDLVLNQDSFPEMGRATVTNYLQWIKHHCTGLVSINHESKPPFPGETGGEHINVSELAFEAGGLKRTERMLYWLRKGYVLERYRTEG